MGGLSMSATFIKRIVDDTAGATAIEYGLILALIFLAIVATFGRVADKTINMWEDVATRVNDAMPD